MRRRIQALDAFCADYCRPLICRRHSARKLSALFPIFVFSCYSDFDICYSNFLVRNIASLLRINQFFSRLWHRQGSRYCGNILVFTHRHATAFHGLMISIPTCLKSEMFRVARMKLPQIDVAAMMPSTTDMSYPFF